MILIAFLPEKIAYDVDKYAIIGETSESGFYISSDSKNELRFKMVIARLTIGKCIKRPTKFNGNCRFQYAVFKVHDLRPEYYEQEKQ